MTLWRQRLSWIVLPCLGLLPAGDAGCPAADPPPAEAPAQADPQNARIHRLVVVDAVVFDDAVPAPPKAEPAQNTYTGGTVVAAANAPPQTEAQPAQPAAKKASLLGSIFDALGDAAGNGPSGIQAIDEQEVRNMEANSRPGFQLLLYVELAFLRRACKPDAKPFAEVAKAASAGLNVPLRQFAVSCYRAQRGGEGVHAADPRFLMQKLLMPLVEAKLGPEKARLYRQEWDDRAEARKHAVVLNVVAALDARLALTGPQRAKLVQSLLTNYQRGWDPYLDSSGPSEWSQLPAIRDESIVPLLEGRQKSVWKQAVKQDIDDVDGDEILQNSIAGDSPEIAEIAQIAGDKKVDRAQVHGGFF